MYRKTINITTILVLIIAMLISCSPSVVKVGLENSPLLGTWETDDVTFISHDLIYDYGSSTKLTFSDDGYLTIERTSYVNYSAIELPEHRGV